MAAIRTAKKLLLGREIAHMISAAGASQAEAARMIETSQGRLNGLLNGTGTLALGDLDLLANGLGFTDEGHKQALRELRRDNHKRGFWTAGHNRAHSEELRLLVDVEQHADRIRWADVEVVPGLFQTEDYIRGMYDDQPDDDGVTVEDRVAARVARQSILDKTDLSIQAVLSESCLRRMWAPPKVMREQIEHLIELSNLPNVMLQVAPFNAPQGRRSLIGARFGLLRVPSPGAAGPLELAYTEGPAEIRYVDDDKPLASYETAWARLSNAALRFEETRQFMRELAEQVSNP